MRLMQSVKTDNIIGRGIKVKFIMVLESRISVHAFNWQCFEYTLNSRSPIDQSLSESADPAALPTIIVTETYRDRRHRTVHC